MDNTILDALVEYPVKALHKIGTNRTIVGLLTNDPSIAVGSDDADSVFDKYLFDYGYVDGTTEEAAAFVCVEAEATRSSETTMGMKLYVTVFCHKNFSKVDTKLFKGMIGNRRDNIVRYVNDVLAGSDGFGIGKLTFASVRTIPAPAGFSARELTYIVPEFSVKAGE